jgi:hypothetical protein
MRTPIVIAISALLALPAAAQAADQATFDMTASGRWESTSVKRFEPGSDCPVYRGEKTESQVLTVRYRGRVTIQHTHNRFNRWYVTPVSGSLMRGPGKLTRKRTDTTEMQYCNQTAWERSDIRDRPLDSSCRRSLVITTGLFKGGFRFGPATGGIGGRCVFDVAVEPFPLGTQNLRLLDPSAPRKLHSRRVVKLSDSERKESSDREGDSVRTDVRSAKWTVTLKRRGPWRPWR